MSRHGIPLLGAAMLIYATWVVTAKLTARAITPPPVAAPSSPYREGVAGSGIIEPASEVIALAIERGGVVTRVDVVAGTKIRTGQPLFGIDDRNYRARVAEDEAAVTAAADEITSIDQSIILQKDTIAQAEATLESTTAEQARAKLDETRYAELSQNSWAPHQRFETAHADLQKADAAHAAAFAALAAAKRQNAVLAARRHEAAAKLAQAEAALEQARVDLDKTVVRAPIDGEILKVNVRLGEYAEPGVLAAPLMTMGATDTLHVRVDIDEADAWRVHRDKPATARLRGNPALSTKLTFVRFEPYVLPKRSLTGDTTERVDTRVLQVIYEFSPKDFPEAYVGQQVDVFVEGPGMAEAAPAKNAAATP